MKNPLTLLPSKTMVIEAKPNMRTMYSTSLPLEDGTIVGVSLPINLTKEEAARIIAFIKVLAI